jgi:hypothetical protein
MIWRDPGSRPERNHFISGCDARHCKSLPRCVIPTGRRKAVDEDIEVNDPRRSPWRLTSRHWLVVLLVGAVAVGAAGGALIGRAAGGRAAGGAGQSSGLVSTSTSPPASQVETTRRVTATTVQPSTTKVGLSTTTQSSIASTHRAPTSTQPGSVLGRRDQRPAGVAAFAKFFAGGSGGRGECGDFDPFAFSQPTIRVPGAYDDGPSSRPDIGEMSVGLAENLCFFRFEPQEPIDVSVTSPTGTVKRLEGCTACEYKPFWFGLPGDPLGTYQVTAEQGSLKAAGSFTLRRAEDRTLLLPDSWLIQGGGVRRSTTILIGVAGFRPYEIVKLLFYYAPNPDSNEGRYWTSLSLQMDAMGQRLYRLLTAPSDPAGYYAVRTLPTFDVQWRENEFTFRLT